MFRVGAMALTRCWHVVRMLEHLAIDWTAWEMRILVIASLLLPACFFTAQNIAYRCVYLLLAVPGLVRLRQSAGDRALRRWLGQMLSVCIVMLWECAIAYNIGQVLLLPSPLFAASTTYMVLQLVYWMGREVLWWWLIAGFLGLAMSCLLRLPLSSEILGWLRRLIPAAARR